MKTAMVCEKQESLRGMMLDKILNSVRKHGLIRRGQDVLVAVSGGADSVAMLLALTELKRLLGLRLMAAHLNHHIRGNEAKKDAEFVRTLAAKLKIPFVGGDADVPRLAKSRGLSMEMAAREARYEFLADAARKKGADMIVTAHTADDQAETVLLKLCRGAGPRGLSGIPRETAINGMRVVRPLLDVTRVEIESFLRQRKQAWREDRTNRDTAYLRNLVRHELLPMLESRLNPGIRAALIRTADILREEDDLLDALARTVLVAPASGRHGALEITKLAKQPLALRRRAICLWLSDSGVPRDAIDFGSIERVEKLMAQKKGSGRVEVAGAWLVRRRYNRIEIVHPTSAISGSWSAMLKVPGRTILKEMGLRISISLKPGLVRQKNPRLGRLPAFASLRRRRSKSLRLLVRSWQPGDRMKPFGMKGSKKLQDIFVDEKVPATERNNVPVFECDGEIVWIPGYRVARGWEVRNPADVAIQVRVERV
jgi:tRNA(Ile)-lysidine synthase